VAELPFVDTHVHFWDLNHPDLYYSWLQPDAIHPVLRNIDEIKFPLYGPEQFLAEVANANVEKVVHVQAALGISDPVNETIWLQEGADRTGIPHGIVAYVDLKRPDAEREIVRHQEASPLVRGIRDFSEGDYLVDSAFQRGFGLLARHGLVCDLDCVWENMWKARDLAKMYADTVIVLDHAGFPRERTPEYFANWRRGMSALAEAENVHCKISGLGMCDNSWTVDSIRPWFEHCLEAFGVERCVLGTNWPVDKMFSPYDTVVDAYAQIVAPLSRDEQIALFSANAERVFRL
jgi:predicted TIM-barrel fold metal-dependent hydrolase